MKKTLFFIICYGLSLFAYASNHMLCDTCHGTKGISPNPLWPNLAGQHPNYLKKQLDDFQQGKDKSRAVMNAIAASLSIDDKKTLAAYYAALPPYKAPKPASTHALGQQLYQQGDLQRRIIACVTCHGPQGEGNAMAGFPALAGQPAPYIQLQLQAFQKGERTNDLQHIMQDISKHLQPKDIEALALYIATLGPHP